MMRASYKMRTTTIFLLPLILLFAPDVITASQPPNIVLIVIDDLGKRLKILKVMDDLRTDTFAIIDDLGKTTLIVIDDLGRDIFEGTDDMGVMIFKVHLQI